MAEPEIIVEDDKTNIVVYGDVGMDCAMFSDAGIELFLKWCKIHRREICRKVF